MCNSRECMRVNEEAFQLLAAFFYCKSHDNSYQYYKLHENLYQVLHVTWESISVTCAVSERGMKSMACMHHYPLWLTCKVASPIDTLSSDYSNLLQLHVKFQYLFSHPVKGWTYAWKALLMMIRGMILICHNCEIFPYNYIITVWNILFTWNYKHTFNGLRWANRVKKWCCQVFNPWIVLPV